MRRRRLFRYSLHAVPGIPMPTPPIAAEICRPQDPTRTARAFESGFAAGMRAAHNPSLTNMNSARIHYTYSDLEKARQRGFEEGRATNPAPLRSDVIDAATIRKKAIDDMLENCRVIAESNPNMTSDAFLKAVQHRSKKV